MIKVERETLDGEQVLRVTFGHWSAACIFLMLWLAGWSFGCYTLVVRLLAKPFEFGEILFALPFFAGEIFVAGARAGRSSPELGVSASPRSFHSP